MPHPPRRSLAFFLAAALALTAAACGGDNAPPAPEATVEPAPEPAYEQADPAPENLSTGQPEMVDVTREIAGQVTIGMSQEEVETLLGAGATSANLSPDMGPEARSLTWIGPESRALSVVFDVDGVIMTTFTDLRQMDEAADAVTLANYSALSAGMSLDEVEAIMGLPPMAISTVETDGLLTDTVTWISGDGAGVVVVLAAGEVVSVSPVGLD
ncbi:MAG: outer membrane protein assembly factor BamE [Promicromonosporaceae bacterium]|nr:outer membrane protein assembly factor BamE [Promicromonosporaceae bacterium]